MSIRDSLSRQLVVPGLKAGRKAAQHAAMIAAPEIDRLVGKGLRSAVTEVARLDAPLRARVPELLAEKYQRMAASPFAFFRGTDALFYRDLARTEGRAAAQGARTVLHGDLHLGNFGTQVARDGKVIYGLNDFDEALAGPAMLDLKRMATSLAVLGDQHALGEHATEGLIDKFAKGYREALEVLVEHPSDIGKALPDKPTVVKELLDKARGREMGHWLDKQAPMTDQGRRLLRSSTVMDLPAATDQGVREAFERYRQSLPRELAADLAPYHVQDVAAAVAGTGSIGRARYRLLLEAPGQEARIMEIKEQVPSALQGVMGPTNPFKTEARRNLVVSEAMNGPLEPFRGEVKAPRLGAMSDYFAVSRRYPAKDELAVEELTGAQLEDLMSYYGAKVAVGHAGGAKVGMAGAAELLADLPKAKRLGRDLASFARTYAPQVQRDHAAFRAAVAQDPLLAKFAAP